MKQLGKIWGWGIAAAAAVGILLAAMGVEAGWSIFIVAGLVFTGWFYYWVIRLGVSAVALRRLEARRLDDRPTKAESEASIEKWIEVQRLVHRADEERAVVLHEQLERARRDREFGTALGRAIQSEIDRKLPLAVPDLGEVTRAHRPETR